MTDIQMLYFLILLVGIVDALFLILNYLMIRKINRLEQKVN